MTSRHDPYRSSASAPVGRGPARSVSDEDVVVLWSVLSPVFLAVAVAAARSGEPFGAGPTVCGGLSIVGVVLAVSAWRRRHPRP